MQIILLEQIKKVGGIGDIVNVKSGFARNFLIPNNKALRATKSNIDLFEVRKKELLSKNQENIAASEAIATKFKKLTVNIIQQAGDDGRLYGSVAVADIANAVNKKTGLEILRKQVVLHDPIKNIGIYKVNIELHAQVIVDVQVNVARNEDEAKIALKEFGKPKKDVVDEELEAIAAAQAARESGENEVDQDSLDEEFDAA